MDDTTAKGTRSVAADAPTTTAEPGTCECPRLPEPVPNRSTMCIDCGQRWVSVNTPEDGWAWQQLTGDVGDTPSWWGAPGMSPLDVQREERDARRAAESATATPSGGHAPSWFEQAAQRIPARLEPAGSPSLPEGFDLEAARQAAAAMHAMYSAYRSAGFSETQAFTLTRDGMAAGLRQ